MRRATKLLPPEGSAERLDLLEQVSRRHYLAGERQQDIAKALGATQSGISRLLAEARKLGIVRFEVNSVSAREQQEMLKKKFPHLKDISIVPYAAPADTVPPDLLTVLGAEAARWFLDRVPHGAKIGVSCGVGVNAAIDAINELGARDSKLPTQCRVYPLIITMMADVVSITPAALVAKLVSSLPAARGNAFQLPFELPGKLSARSPRDFYMQCPEVRRLLENTKDLDCYLIGVGFIDVLGKWKQTRDMAHMATHEFNSLVWRLGLIEALDELGAVGESLHQPFDATGEFLLDRPELKLLREHMLYLPLAEMSRRVHERKADVVAVAGGHEKVDAIRAALRAKIFNVLVIDSSTAGAILGKGEMTT